MLNRSILYLSIGVLFIYSCSQILLSWKRAAFRAKHGCKPPPALSQRTLYNGFERVVLMRKWFKERKFLQNQEKLYKDHGKTFSIRLGGETRIQTIEPENIKTILASKAEDFEVPWIRLKAFEPVSGSGVASSNGATWSHGRALLRPAFSKPQIANLQVYERHFQNLVNLLPRDGSTVDMQKLFSKLTMDTATEILFGESVHSLISSTPEKFKAVGDALDYTQGASLRRAQSGYLIYILKDSKLDAAVETLNKYVATFVNHALELRRTATLNSKKQEDEESKPKNYIFLHELAKDSGDPKVLRDQLLSVLAAGRDTTAGLLNMATWHLARHSNVQARLREEIASLNGAPPTYEELKNLVYLRWILNESLRVLSVVAVNARSATRDTILPVGGGPDGKSPVFVAKGQIVFYNAYALHRDKELWGDDAEEFKPERWGDELNRKVTWKYVPFGGGPRVCIGQQLALTEAAYTIVRLFQTFSKLEYRGDKEFHENVGVVLLHENGVQVSFTN